MALHTPGSERVLMGKTAADVYILRLNFFKIPDGVYDYLFFIIKFVLHYCNAVIQEGMRFHA